MMQPRLPRPLSMIALMLLGGCAVGPDFHQPAPPAAAQFANVPNITIPHLQPGADIPAQWWTLFRSPKLDGLVRLALADSPDLASAQATLRQSQELLKAQRGALLPSVEADAGTTRARNPGVLASPLQSNDNLYTLHTAQLSVSYGIDLFGGTRRSVEAAAAMTEAQAFETQAARLTLTSNLVVAAIAEASIRAQITATHEAIDAARHMLTIMQARETMGDAAGIDVAAQESQLAQIMQALPPLQKQLAQQRDLIAVLCGHMPGDATIPTFAMADLTLPAGIPLSLPARLVDQRPDIRVAQANLHAAAANVGVAIAARLPAITLSGALGGSSTRLSTLLAPANILWDVTGGLVQPLFQGGALLHRQRAAQAAYDAAKAQYRGTVLVAFQNVADVLAALQSDTDAFHAATAAQQAAARTREIAQGQLRLGAIATLQALSAEQAYWQAESAQAQAQAALHADTAALLQALGGGWWNTDTAPYDPPS